MGIWQPPFDPAREFVAKASLLAGGVRWERNRPFDKGAVNARVLRQLYEAHQIDYAPKTYALPQPVAGAVLEDAAAIAASPPASRQSARATAEPPAGDPSSSAGGTPTSAAGADEKPAAKQRVAARPDALSEAESKALRLARKHSHDELFTMASGLAGVTKDQTKVKIAEALVKAGRGVD